jgi:5-methylcytosine-specific restriction endonuclease McrA
MKTRSVKKQADINERKTEAKRREAAYGGIPPCLRCERPAEVLHHVIRQSQGGTNDPDNLINLCGGCHDYVHQFVAESKEKGWLA